MNQISIASIRVNGGTQSRAGVNREAVSEYAAAMAGGAVFPPLTVFYDGAEYWLADGFHRYHAYADNRAHHVPVEVRQGSRRDAILFSVGANAEHGLRRTNDDKRRAVATLLSDPEWAAWSDREIARQCGVSNTFVSAQRGALTVNVDSEDRVYTSRHGTQAVMNTARIGADTRSEPTEAARESDCSPKPDAPEADPDAKMRRELSKLTPAALVDDLIATRKARAEDKARIAALRGEVDALKADLDAFQQGDIGRALGNAQRQARTAEGRAREFQNTAVRLDRRVKMLEAEVKRMKGGA